MDNGHRKWAQQQQQQQQQQQWGGGQQWDGRHDLAFPATAMSNHLQGGQGSEDRQQQQQGLG
jgi:hypothetical protein